MTLQFKTAFLWLTAAVLLGVSVGCSNDVADKKWPPPVTRVEESPVLSPKEALQSFSVPPGFRVEPVAAEPLVVDPVDIDIDSDGRLWAVEMRGWMKSILPSEEEKPIGQIVVLEDTNSDGRMDQSTVFLDSLKPRGVLVLKEGVLVAEPSHLWLAKDTDGDLKADTTISVRDDYGDPEGNPEAMANSPTWGMDNWIHNAHYPGRFRQSADGSLQHDSTLALGQWGTAMNDYGRFFRTWNANPLVTALIDPHYFTRNPNMVGAQGSDVTLAKGPAKKVWPTRSPARVNRGYREGLLRKDSTLRIFTAASAPGVYRGDRYPEGFQNDVFVPEPAGHLVRRFEITRREDGTLKATNAYDKAEFMVSTDERFRPVDLYSAPDGTLYVVDMYAGVIQHRNFLSQYLKAHIQKNNLLKPQGMGRIYRVVYEPNAPRREKPQLTSASNKKLARRLDHPNGWWRDAAQQLLVERGATGVAPTLEAMVRSGGGERARLHALWTLKGVGALTLETVRGALSDSSFHVRAAAVRLSEPWLRKGNSEMLRDVANLTDDPAPKVRMQLAASLGEVPPPAADSVLVQLLASASKQPYLSSAVVSGLKGRELTFLRRLVQTEGWEKQKTGRAHTLQTLASTIINTGNSETINRMVQLIGDEAGLPRWQRLALLDGIEERLPDGKTRPLRLREKPTTLAEVLQASDPKVQKKARNVADRLVWPGKEGYEKSYEATLLTAEEKQRFARGEQVYKQVCSTCHQPDGRGQEGVAPTLVGSRWALGQEKDAARIVLDGKEGETGLMPPHENKLSDKEIAAVLTYIRNAWGNEASPISPSLAEEVRNATAPRDRPWTEEELRVILH
jgi:mono/diheme cytochrome c family protein/glucose/arabinose dehydrogenase